MALNEGTLPLSQALPWSSEEKNCILVTDSIETDGRFVLHSVSCEALAKKHDVLWLSCGPVTTKQVATALRKAGCEAAASFFNSKGSDEWSRPLSIHSILIDLLDLPVVQDSHRLKYLKALYHRVKEWCLESSNTTIIVDDSSCLAKMLGERFASIFLSYLRSLDNGMLVIRCSNDCDKLSYQQEVSPGTILSHRTNWVGAGGQDQPEAMTIPWERTLVEYANWIVDVVPLTSGFSREAHGRLVFTPRAPIWKQTLVMNYCLQDAAIVAIRLRN